MARNKNKGVCPRHGSAFMKQEGASYYCEAPTPGEISKKCFYHPTNNHPKELETIAKKRAKERKGKPNLWKVMEEEWRRNKENRIKSRDKFRQKAKEKLALQ